jgi:hypothetical protein
MHITRDQKQEEAIYIYFSDTKNDLCKVNCEVNVFDNDLARILFERGVKKQLSQKSLCVVLTHLSIMNRALHDDCISELKNITIRALGEEYEINKKCIKRAIKQFNHEVTSLKELLDISCDSSLSAVAPE